MALPASHKVPWEIIEYFVDLCWADYGSLRQLALTCQGLLPRSRMILFRHVRIHTRTSLSCFVNAISTRPELAGLVVELTIIPVHSDMSLFAPFTSFSRVFPSLRAMSLGVDPTLSTPHYAPHSLRFNSVLSLEIADVTFRDHSDLVKLLWTFPKLRTLRLGAITFGNAPTKEEIASLSDHSIRRNRVLYELEAVEIQVGHNSV